MKMDCRTLRRTVQKWSKTALMQGEWKVLEESVTDLSLER